MSALQNARKTQLLTCLTLALVVSCSVPPVAAVHLRAPGTANKLQLSGLAAWWTGHDQYDPLQRSHALPSSPAGIKVTGSNAPARRHSSYQGPIRRQKDILPTPMVSAGGVQHALPVRSKSADLHAASEPLASVGSGLERSAPDRGQNNDFPGQRSAFSQPLRRSGLPGLLCDQGTDTMRHSRQGRRLLAASAASNVPRATLQDVLLTDDELAYTEHGAEPDSALAAEARSRPLSAPASSGITACEHVGHKRTAQRTAS